jgi:hypothetical protein
MCGSARGFIRAAPFSISICRTRANHCHCGAQSSKPLKSAVTKSSCWSLDCSPPKRAPLHTFGIRQLCVCAKPETGLSKVLRTCRYTVSRHVESSPFSNCHGNYQKLIIKRGTSPHLMRLPRNGLVLLTRRYYELNQKNDFTDSRPFSWITFQHLGDTIVVISIIENIAHIQTKTRTRFARSSGTG